MMEMLLNDRKNIHPHPLPQLQDFRFPRRQISHYFFSFPSFFLRFYLEVRIVVPIVFIKFHFYFVVGGKLLPT